METTETPEPITMQMLVNRTADRYLVQKLPFGFDPHRDRCVYRGDNGVRCSIGHEIPDSLYHIYMEGKSANDVWNKFPEIHSIFATDINDNCKDYEAITDRCFLNALQSAHDVAAKMNHRGSESRRLELASQLMTVCEEWELTVPESVRSMIAQEAIEVNAEGN